MTLGGRRVDPSYVRRLFPRLGQRAAIEKRVHAHGLRHSFASELVQEGVPANVIRSILGHADLAVTTRYVDHLAPTQVTKAMQRRTWRGQPATETRRPGRPVGEEAPDGETA